MSQAAESLYARVREEVSAREERLWDVSLALHREPETAYEENRAARLLAGELEREGFEVQRGVADLPTAFLARTGSGNGSGKGPCVALLMEYDALPLLGHACGHNLIAAAGRWRPRNYRSDSAGSACRASCSRPGRARRATAPIRPGAG